MMKKILINEETIDKLQLASKQNIINLKLLFKVLECDTLKELDSVKNEIIQAMYIFDNEVKNIK